MIDLPDYVKAQALDPKWHEATKVHEWRNHVPDHVRAIWGTFTEAQKLALAAWAEEDAQNEHWD